MVRRKIVVAVILAVTVVGAFAAYAFRPTATSTNVAVNEPPTDGNTGTGTGTTPSSPQPPPARASEGPKHSMCVHANDHIPEHAWVHGANWYRFYDRTACAAAEMLAGLLSL